MTTGLNPTDIWESNKDCINIYVHQGASKWVYVDAYVHGKGNHECVRLRVSLF